MKLIVKSPHKQVFDGLVKQVSLPTDIGEITILPNHMPLVTSIKPGLIKIQAQNPEEFNKKTFVFEEQYITLSTSEGVAYIDGEHITVMVNTSNAHPGTFSEEELQKKKKQLEEQIENLDNTIDKEEIQQTHKKIETIEADLKLIKISNGND